MSIEFNIIYEKLLKIGEDLKTDNIDQNFFNKVNIYKNFFNQMMQILNQPNTDISQYKTELEKIESNNIYIENRLRKEKENVKDKIIKTNLKEQIKKKYN